jgi:quercetin dioxygenase-like cupin family protein
MIVTRWLAPIAPTESQIKVLLESEGLEPYEEIFEPKVKVSDHRHPFCEIRVVVKGELHFNISGNQFLLREGDRIEVPANTKHAHINNGNQNCLCVVAQRAF